MAKKDSGKFVKYVSSPCPDCEETRMEIRVYTDEEGSEKDYIVCPSCGYTEKISYNQRGKVNANHKRRGRTEKDY